MRRIVLALMGTVSGIVLLFSYHTSTNSGSGVAQGASGGTPSTDLNGSADQSGSTATPSTSSAAPTTSSGSSSSSSSSKTSAGTSGTFDGDAVGTQWGTVQVEITVANGQITKSKAIQYPDNNGRDQEINAYALPQLNHEVVQGQSANIDAISGATVTSDGYITSLQSAVDKAHL